MIRLLKKKVPFLLAGLLAVGFVACEDDDNEMIQLSADPLNPVLADLDITRIELDGNNVGNPAATFSWEAADYGEPTEIKYTLEFASTPDFATPAIAGIAIAETSLTLSMSGVNAGAGAIGLPPFEWNTVYARIVASVGEQNALPETSNTIEFEVYPYFNYPFEDYFLVGDATAPNWDNNNSNPAIFRDASNANVFTYTGRFAGGGHFKLLNTLGQWQPQWGSNEATRNPDGSASGAVNVNPGDTDDPERFPYAGGDGVPEGYYTFIVDFGANTFTFETYDTSGAPELTSINLQGSATAGDVTMMQSSFDPHIWSASNVTLSQGELQFVTNTGATWGATTEFSGQATEGSEAIPVPVQDEYNVWFNDLTGTYIMIPINLSQS